MARNRVSMQVGTAELAELDAALDTIERVLAGLVSLTVADRLGLIKMGNKSEVFCRQTLRVLSNNPEIVPPRLDVAEALRDLETIDALRPRMHRFARLAERTRDTEMALGADVMETAMEGYALLKVSGKAMGLDSQRREIGTRFARRKRRADPVEEAEAPPADA